MRTKLPLEAYLAFRTWHAIIVLPALEVGKKQPKPTYFVDTEELKAGGGRLKMRASYEAKV